MADKAVADFLLVCDYWYSTVKSTLASLIFEVSLGDEIDPLVRDGPPNRWTQKVLRELNAVSILMHLVQTTFNKGVSHQLHVNGKSLDMLSGFCNISELLNLCFRLLQMMMKEDNTSARQLFWFWKNNPRINPLNTLGNNINGAGCIIALFKNRHELLKEIRLTNLLWFPALLQYQYSPRMLACW